MQEKNFFSGFYEGIRVIFECIGMFDPNQEYLVIPNKETGSVVPVRILGNKIHRPEQIIS
jgi:hypothetical protein